MTVRTLPLALGLLVALSTRGITAPGSPGQPSPKAAAPDAEKRALAVKAREVLKTHCYRCHGKDGAVEGSLNYVADLAKLVVRKKVVPGDPAGSRLFKRIDEGTMPPPDENPRPSPAEIETIRKWIAAGAPGAEPPTTRAAVSPTDINTYILADLDTLDRRSRRFQRYFTLTHLYNAGLSDEELQTYRNALSKLVNSLSWNSRIMVPVAVDPAKTVLRIDLRWYLWDATIWTRILAEYPYGILDDNVAARAVMVGTAARVPIVRADWFVATASRAPLYYDVLQLPPSLTELERQLRVDAVQNIQQERVTRVGFLGSGVSRFNRILERHDSAQGMYWRTYDFDEPPANLVERANGALLPDRRNIFAFPLGPGLVAEPFQHAGGEAIFALPNGLHAYYLVNAANVRLDKGPIAIVSDPKRPDRAVEAGVSCMSCHVTGILPKADQVRDHLDKNPKALRKDDAELARALYPSKDKSLALMQDDAKKYAEVVAKTGAKVSKYEAVSTITLKYEADMDLPTAAAEVGLTPEQFRGQINASDVLTKHVGALRAAGGTVSRQIWVQAFGDVVRELRLGVLFQANLNGPTLPDNTGEIDPLESAGGAANQIAIAPDGRWAVIASGDRGVRLRDVIGRRDLKLMVGHRASVWAVALSADGRYAISGSMDGTARVWNLQSGSEVRTFAGHDSLVSAVAFNPNGKWGVSGSFDGTLAVWKVANGEELWRAEKLGLVTSVAVDPSGGYLVVGVGRSVCLFDLNNGKLIRKHEKQPGIVGAVAVSPNGKWYAAGCDDGTVRVWFLGEEKARFTLTGHVGPVRGVAVKDGGRWILSAGTDRTLRLWDTDTKKDVAVFRKHNAPVVSAAFLDNGTQTISGDRDLAMLPWEVAKFVNTRPEPTPVVTPVVTPKPAPPPVVAPKPPATPKPPAKIPYATDPPPGVPTPKIPPAKD